MHQLDALCTNPLAERAWRGTASPGGALIRAPVLWEVLSHHGLRQLFIEERDVPVRHLRCRGWRRPEQLKVLADLLEGATNAVDRENVKRAVEGLRTLYLDGEGAYPEEASHELDRVLRACRAAKIAVVREGDGDQKAGLVSAEFWARATRSTAGEGQGASTDVASP